MKNKYFDDKTIAELKAYVYALFDPLEVRPFYIGKGRGNRVFQHVEGAIQENKESNKYEIIREIRSREIKNRVNHTIIRHGMSDEVAFEVESALIDLANRTGAELTNEVIGHNSIENGIMNADEVMQKGLSPKDITEWRPFIEGYKRIGRENDAHLLSRRN